MKKLFLLLLAVSILLSCKTSKEKCDAYSSNQQLEKSCCLKDSLN
jgi:hypothetical protein